VGVDWVGCHEGGRWQGSIIHLQRPVPCGSQELQNQTFNTAVTQGVPLHTEQSLPHTHTLFDVFLWQAVKA
jgi:hypothetical protein